MTEFILSPRHFPRTDLAADTVLVVPDECREIAAVRHLQEVVGAAGGRKPDIVQQGDFNEDLFRQAQVIACGHMANNAALRRLYIARCCFVDTFFPGGDGYFVKSVCDPFSYGKNCIVVGASSRRGLEEGLGAFADIVETSTGTLERVHAARLPHALPSFPDEAELPRMVQDDLDTWDNGWVSAPFRGGQVDKYAWYYYLTDHAVWGHAVPAIFAGSLAHWEKQRRERPETYHCLFHFDDLIRLWDLIEDSPLYTDEDRRGVVQMMAELLRHLAGIFYMDEGINPAGWIRQNHTTYIALDLAVGHDYMQRRYGISEFAPTEAVAERIFAGQADCYKPNDDGGVGYVWLVPEEVLTYQLFKKADYSYIENGHIADLCTLAMVTTDNMRSETNYGDTAGYNRFSDQGWQARLWPLMVSTWYSRDPQHLWMLNWLGAGKRPALGRVVEGLYAAVEWGEEGFMLDGVTPEEPEQLLGMYAMELPPKAQQWVADNAAVAHRPDPDKNYFDKLSLRRSFSPADEYLLLEGTGTFCHGHEDANAIIRLTWNDRAWLADGDYIRAAPKFHNSIEVIRDGVGVWEAPGEGLLVPPLASLNYRDESAALDLLQTEVAQYNGLDWRRNIFWGKGRYIAVVDQLHCNVAGTYHCRCLWRMVGDPQLDAASTRLHQQGEDFYIRNADGAAQEVVADPHQKSRWTAYPYADAGLHVLHQKAARSMQVGEDLIYLNVLTPHADIGVERLNQRALRLRDDSATSVLGVGSMEVGDVAIEATMFGVVLEGDMLALQGVERVGILDDGEWRWTDFNGAFTALDVGSGALARRLEAVVNGVVPSPMPAAVFPQIERPQGTWSQQWMYEMGSGEISALHVGGESLLVGSESGDVAQLTARDGAEMWRQHLDEDTAASALLLADLDADGILEALVGTTQSKLLVLEGPSGTLRWARPLKNMWARGITVPALAIADLQGQGQPSILAATEGWYVNAFAADGTPQWAEWVRYHAITALAVTDADNDGRAEVIVGTEYSTPLNVHNSDGSFRWTTFEEVGSEGNATTPRRGICLTHLLLHDMDNDGTHEIVYGTEDGWIYVVKPQDGTEVWHANIVGQVKDLVSHPTGLFAASEYGTLYFFNWRGYLLWHLQVSNWIRSLSPLTDGVAVAAPDGLLLDFSLDGTCRGSHSMAAEIRALHPCDNGVVCHIEGGSLSYIVSS